MQERASGWMADFGEGIPYDAVLHSEEGAAAFHNRYAEEWAEVNRKAIREAGRGDEIAFLADPASTRAPVRAPCFGSVTSSSHGLRPSAPKITLAGAAASSPCLGSHHAAIRFHIFESSGLACHPTLPSPAR